MCTLHSYPPTRRKLSSVKPDDVEHGSGLGACLKWGDTPHYLPYPYPCPYPYLYPYPYPYPNPYLTLTYQTPPYSRP